MEGKRLEDSQASHHDQDRVKIKEINLKALFLTVKKRLWLVMVITILFTVAAGFFNSKPETPMYVSNTRMIVTASSDMMGTVRVLFREPIVLDQVIEKLGLNLSAAALRSQIRVDSVDASLVTVVSVMDTDPRLAAEIANTAVETYRQVASEVLGITSIRLLTKAEENPFPINEKSNRIVYIAFLLGMILSVGLVFLLDSLDDSIKSEREVEELLGLTMLGQVNKIKRKDYASSRLKKQKSISVRGETIGS